jgi:hypothetical protein
MGCDIDKKGVLWMPHVFLGYFHNFGVIETLCFVQLAGINEHDLHLGLKRPNNKA